MNWFLQCLPGFTEATEAPSKIPFETTTELLSLDVLRECERQVDFSHFALDGNVLLEVHGDGSPWFVVGFLGDSSGVELPAWEGGRLFRELDLAAPDPLVWRKKEAWEAR